MKRRTPFSSFLEVLASEDEAGLAALVYPASAKLWLEKASGLVSAGLAGIESDQASVRELRIVHTARILTSSPAEPTRVAFGLMRPAQGESVVSTPTPAYALALIRDDGTWKVWGKPDATEFADAELVRLPISEEFTSESLSVVASNWLIALESHLDGLEALKTVARPDEASVSPRECAHAIAALSMLVFAVEAIVARLAALGRVSNSTREVWIQALADKDLQDDLGELLVVRDVIAHNHVWKTATTFDTTFRVVAVDNIAHLVGRRNRGYQQAVAPAATRTRRLSLHVIPTELRRWDVSVALGVAVRTFDRLAKLDVTNMRSLADNPVRVGGRISPLRALTFTEGGHGFVFGPNPRPRQ